MKTSLTHPLELPAVELPGGGKIGMSLCPGKRQLLAATGPWDRDLRLDIVAIKAFGATLLVTLMESSELIQAQVPAAEINAAAAAVGIEWMHLPIRDFEAPSAVFETIWPQRSDEISRRLRRGENVVLHCRGGRGRSGMIAARLLLDSGLSADEAIARVRAVNPLGMETPIQEDYVRRNGMR